MTLIKPVIATRHIRENIQSLFENYGTEKVQSILNEMMGTRSSPYENQDVEISEVNEFYIESNYYSALAPSTRRGYKYEVKSLTKFATNYCSSPPKLLNLLEPQLIASYLSQYTGNANTHGRKCGFFSAYLRVNCKKFFNIKIDDDEDLMRLFKNIDNPEDEIPRALPKEQLLEVVDLSMSGNTGHRNFTMIMTFLQSGIRLGELTHLRIGDIAKENSTFKVLAKGFRGRRVKRHITALGYSILKDYIDFSYRHSKSKLTNEEYNNLFVFSVNGGKRAISSRTVQTFVSKLIAKARSIPEDMKDLYSPHTFRHCFAVYGLESGIDIYTLMRLLGHGNIETTTIYLKVFTDQLQAAIESHPFAKGITEEADS